MFETPTLILFAVFLGTVVVDCWLYINLRKDLDKLRKDIEALTADRPSAIGFMTY